MSRKDATKVDGGKSRITRRKMIFGGLSGAALAAGGSAVETPGASSSVITSEDGIPRRAATAIEDMLVYAARIKPGQRVLILAYIDGLYGGDNLVDRDAIHWIARAVEAHGAKPRILWVDQPAEAHAWQFPFEVRKAMDECDLMINHSFDLVVEEIMAFRQYVEFDRKLPMVRNFATTAPLLLTDWALTPHELVSEIRYQAAKLIQAGEAWRITDPNGTHLEGVIGPARNPAKGYAVRREEGTYLPWPEWVAPPIRVEKTSGVFIFDCMLSWWSRYIGISPYFSKPIRLQIENNRILKIEGGPEAERLRRFLEQMRSRLGDGVYAFDTLHFGVHPHAEVEPHLCPSPLYRRLIEHSNSRNLHVHIGSPQATKDYPYWMHVTGDIRSPTFSVGGNLIHDCGRLTILDSSVIKEIAAKYPGRPGV